LFNYFARSLVRYNLVLYLTVGAAISFLFFKHRLEIFFQNLATIFFAQLYICLISVLVYLLMEKEAPLKTWPEIRRHNPKLFLWILLSFMICLLLITPLFNFPDMYHAAILPPVFNLIRFHSQPVLFSFLNGGILVMLALAAYLLLRQYMKKSEQN